jgi:hypothetical protein
MLQIRNSFLKTFLFILGSSTISFAQNTLSVNAGKNVNLCFGSYAELTATVEGGTPPYSYKWTPNDELSDASAETVMANSTFNTTFKVIVTDAKGMTARDEVEVFVYQRPTIIISIEPNEKAKLDVKVVEPNGALTYSWRPSSGLDNANSASPTATPKMTTTYTVMVKDSKGCYSTQQVTVEIANRTTSAVLENR